MYNFFSGASLGKKNTFDILNYRGFFLFLNFFSLILLCRKCPIPVSRFISKNLWREEFQRTGMNNEASFEDESECDRGRPPPPGNGSGGRGAGTAPLGEAASRFFIYRLARGAVPNSGENVTKLDFAKIGKYFRKR